LGGGILRLIATAIDRCGPPRSSGRGRPPTDTVRALTTSRRFLREGTPWRGLIATEAQASGSTLRRCLGRWCQTGLLARGHSDLILDSCSVLAEHGSDLTRPNPTDRAKRGTKYHVAVDGDGVPVACVATAASVNDTLVFARLFLAAFAVVARVRTVFADKGCDAERHRNPPPPPPEALHPQARSPTWIGPGQAALARRAQPRLGAGEQAPRAPP
jgi:hypothetical protein